MKSKRFSVEQIVSAIKQHEAGLSVAEIARKMGGAEGALYAWRRNTRGLSPTKFVSSSSYEKKM